MYNDALASVEHRINAAQYAPYRPRLQDIEAKREDQLRKKMLVTGFDAQAGIRPLPRQYRMAHQHRAPGKVVDQKSFQDMLFDLQYITDDKIDTVVAPSASEHADVR